MSIVLRELKMPPFGCSDSIESAGSFCPNQLHMYVFLSRHNTRVLARVFSYRKSMIILCADVFHVINPRKFAGRVAYAIPAAVRP